ncbi:TetR/AcrR family transcriptional regulator [Rhodococcus tukisamuensis]|uniref:DNA-binding transcriptional regulator, AcrR family n=1 Tax=Rhodococcus tukisamuensis TaxID=168276 RepID=A0A1G6R5V8_9NOCA|nr:TetR/AcrR family transcriptional regulator [Rhodococcus tukisamuensis]SDC99407.1 DNA-binding transcriptional regulator, AcrR family [Rhodococcus tukisamuensis]
MSIRNEDSGVRDAAPSVDDLILDAARTCVLEFGLRRTTLAEIARRAGVSRPTVYRRWPDTRAVVGDLLTREIRQALPEMSGPHGAREQLVNGVVEVAEKVRTHPLFVKIVRSDPELLVPYIVDRLGASQRAIIDVLTPVVDAGQRDGSIRAGDPAALATMVLLIAQSAVQSAGIVADVLSPDALVEELRLAVDAYLTPR